MSVNIRPEKASDIAAIRAINQAAFPGPAEAQLVDLLRARSKILVSLVAETDQNVVGHILFSLVSIDLPQGTIMGAGLAPVAVLPVYQKQGIGKRLIQEGLIACQKADCPLVVVLGDPDYYQKFGFQPASKYGLRNEYNVDEEFMIVIFQAKSLPEKGGMVKYAPEFVETGV